MTTPTPRDDLDAAAAELLALQHTDHPLPGWDVTCAVCRLTPAEAFRLGYRAAVAAYRAAQDGGACGDLSPGINFGGDSDAEQLMCDLPVNHGGAHQHNYGDGLPPMRWIVRDDARGSR